MLKDLNTDVANEIVVHLIETTKNGRFIEFNQEKGIVLWFDKIKNEYIVHSVQKGSNDNWCLENGSYFDNADSAMLCFLKRKGIKLDIEIDFSEEDIDNLRGGESFNWTYTDKKYKYLEVDVKIYNSALEQ
jgi:hypothetical protein